MLSTLTDPLILLILALLLTQSLVYFVGGLKTLRRQPLNQGAQARARRELVEWGLLDPAQRGLPPAAKTVLDAWARLAAQGRAGMGAGILVAAALLLALLSVPAVAALLSGMPPLILLVLLLLQALYLGMVAGQSVALVRGLSRLARTAPAGEPPALQTPHPAPAGGPPALHAPHPAPAGGPPALQAPRLRSLARYRSLQLALLPSGLLVGDVLLLGLIDRPTLSGLPPAEVWGLLILPAVMLVVCVGGEYTMRRLARLPALCLSDDPALAERADARLRAHLIGLTLELEVFGLFILVGSQWMLRVFALPDSSGLATAALLVSGVIMLSLRGLLDRSQRERKL
jgi:hypothetical protein